MKVVRDLEMIVAQCHRSWGHREDDTAFSGVEQIVAPCHRSWRNRDGDKVRDVVPQVLLRLWSSL